MVFSFDLTTISFPTMFSCLISVFLIRCVERKFNRYNREKRAVEFKLKYPLSEKERENGRTVEQIMESKEERLRKKQLEQSMEEQRAAALEKMRRVNRNAAVKDAEQRYYTPTSRFLTEKQEEELRVHTKKNRMEIYKNLSSLTEKIETET